MKKKNNWLDYIKFLFDLVKNKKENIEEKLDRVAFIYDDDDLKNICYQDCGKKLKYFEDRTGLKTFIFNQTKDSLIDKVKDGVVDLVLRLVTVFVKYALGGLLLPISLAFAGVGVATNVITANENKKEENKVIVYGSGVNKETTYNDVVVKEETIVDVIKEDIVKNDEQVIEEVPIDEQMDETMEEHPLTLEEFLDYNDNSSFEKSWQSYHNYSMNLSEFKYPFEVDGYTSLGNGTFYNFCKQYAGEKAPTFFSSIIDNVVYESRPIDMNRLYDDWESFDTETEAEIFAKLTFTEINGKWYLVSDEPCSISYKELFESQGVQHDE